MPNRDWYNYFREKSIEESKLFEDNDKRDIGKEFDRLFKRVKQTYGHLNLNLRLEKMTYNFITGKKERIVARNKQLFEKRFTIQRLSRMANKYSSVKSVLELYETEYITLDELNEYLAEFKENDKGYLRNYGK